MDLNLFNRVASRIDGYVNEIIEMQGRLTAAQAIGPENDGKGEYEKAEYVKEMLEKIDPDEVIEVNAPDERVPNGFRPNIVAFFNGEAGDRTLWIITHLDVVPPGDLKLWNTDPFKVELRDGKLYGRGVEDNQQSLIASYMAVKALRDSKVKPHRRIGLLFVSDEETGSERGLKYVLSERMDLFGEKDFYIVPDGGNSDGTLVEIAEKSILWLRFQVIGRQGHGSRPDQAVNSFKAGSYLITRLDQLYSIFDERDELYEVPTSTFEPTKKEANVPNINTIPGEDVFYMDCRILPKINVDEVINNINGMAKEIEAEFKVKVNISIVQRADAAPPTPPDSPAVRALLKAIKAVNGRNGRPMGIGGGTVAAILRRAGFPAVVWATMDETAHQPNEYCILKNLINDAKVFLHISLQEDV
ncbi:MAG: M20 family metallo-hydrolase [Candidatus Bathyarchaeia archaeon]